MTEYIERDKILEKKVCTGLCDAQGNMYGAGDVVLVNNIEAIPAADVAPVRHGQWVQTRVVRYNGDKPYTQFSHVCSLCNYLNKRKKGWNTKFCPNCGAKMDKEDTK